jgi:sugar phosphate isomerase/epimerase
MRKVGATLYKAVQKKFGLQQLLSFLQEAKFNFVELYLVDEEMITPTLDFNQEKIQEFKELAESYEFGITAHGLYDNYNGIISNLADLDDTIRKKAILATKKSIELCNFLNSQVLVIHPGTLYPNRKREKKNSIHLLATHPVERSRSKGLENIYNSLKELLTHAENFGVAICLENEVPRFESIPLCDNPFALFHLCQKFEEEFGDTFCGITLDFGHLALETVFYGYDLLRTTEALLPLVKHFHFHDNRMIPSPLGGTKAECEYGDLHYPLGKGSIPYADIFPLLKNGIGNDVLFNLELFRAKKMDDFQASKQIIEAM